MASKKLRILPLGGLGEVGMNCMLLEYDSQVVLIDCGIQFADASYPGIEMLLPDLRYLYDRLDQIVGVVVTHGHDDHIGGIPYLLKHTPLHVYATPFPTGLLKNKLVEHSRVCEIHFHEIDKNEPFELGPFKFHPIRVQHSIIESLAFAIETPIGTVIHTGDFKHDPNEISGEQFGFEAFEAWGKKGVHLLLSDSTNAERAGHTISERDIAESFKGILEKQTGRLIIALFASNIRRVESILKEAALQGKKVALCGRSMLSYTKLAFDQSSLHIPNDTLIPLENIGKYQDSEVIVLATGSQAEPQSALVRVSQGIHKDLQIRSGDVVILSSRFIPGNERNITKMIDELYRAGAEVLYESVHQIHVSGHGFQEELLLMLNATRPKFFVPIHGEYRHLKKHASLAKRSGVKDENIHVIEDGQILEIGESEASLGDRLELSKIPLVSGEEIQVDEDGFLDRLALAKTGVVVTALARDRKTGDLLCDPQIVAKGVLFRESSDAQTCLNEASEALETLFERKGDNEDFDELTRLEMRRYFKHHATHKPQVISVTLDV